MSRIYFHTLNETAEVSGAERAWSAQVCRRMTEGLGDRYTEWAIPLLPKDNYLKGYKSDGQITESDLKIFFSQNDYLVDEERIPGWLISLNTAVDFGNDTIRLFARLHGQCEIHCYVRSENKNWLADIIECGLELSLYREKMGWESVVKLLRKKNKSAVVCSYSVCESFPNFGLLPNNHKLKKMEGDERYELFYDIPENLRWEFCYKTLKKEKSLEISPDNLHEQCFSNGMNIIELMDHAYEMKKEKAK